MSPLTEVGIVAQREIIKNFRSAKGIALSALTLLGAAGLSLIFILIEEAKRKLLQGATPEQMAEASHSLARDFARASYNADVASALDAIGAAGEAQGESVWLTAPAVEQERPRTPLRADRR